MILFIILELLPRQDHNLVATKELVSEISHDLHHGLILGIATWEWSWLKNMLRGSSFVTLNLSS